MKEFYKKRFALTDGGARNLSKATLASFFVYCINMLPAILLMIFCSGSFGKYGQKQWLLYSILSFDFDSNVYFAFYRIR